MLLLVEDDDLAALAFMRWLRDWPMILSRSAEEAREVFASRTDWIGVIVDAGLPEGSAAGVDLVRWIRERAPGLPIALTSGQDSDEIRIAAPILDVPFLLKLDVPEQFAPFLRRCARYTRTRPERILEDARARFRLKRGEADLLEWLLSRGNSGGYADARSVSRSTYDKRRAGLLRKSGYDDLAPLAIALWKEARDGER